MDTEEYQFIIGTIDDKLTKLGRRIDMNILYLLIMDFLGILNLIQPSWVKGALPKILPTDTEFVNLIIPLALFYFFFNLGYTSIKYFKKRKQLNDFIFDYGKSKKLAKDDPKLERIFTVFRPVTLGEVFYTYYRGLAIKKDPEENEITIPFTLWIYFVFTTLINILLAASNSMVFYYCYRYISGPAKWITIVLYFGAIFICYYDYTMVTKKFTGTTKNILVIAGINAISIVLFFVLLQAVFPIYN